MDGHAHAIDGDQIADWLTGDLAAVLGLALELLHHFVDDRVFDFVGTMRRHGRRRPGLRQRVFEIGHALCGVSIEHVADRKGEDQAVVIAAPERLVEKEMAGFFEPGDRADLIHAALHVGMPGLPVIGARTVLDQHWISRKQPGRLHIGDEHGAFVLRRDIARQHDADFVGEDLFALIIHHTAAIAVAVEAERDVGLARQHRVAHRVQHF